MSETVGGRVDITIDGVTYNAAAEIDVDESNIEVDVVDNSNGSIGRSVKSSHYEAEIKLRHMKGLSIQDLLSKRFDMTMVERDLGQTLLWTGAFLKGKPKRNVVNGEISGLTVVTDNYRRV